VAQALNGSIVPPVRVACVGVNCQRLPSHALDAHNRADTRQAGILSSRVPEFHPADVIQRAHRLRTRQDSGAVAANSEAEWNTETARARASGRKLLMGSGDGPQTLKPPRERQPGQMSYEGGPGRVGLHDRMLGL
jgi:hypothetical protein